MKCPHCNQEHPNGYQFCPTTGKKIEMLKACSNPKCLEFGKQILPMDSVYCPTCGSKLTCFSLPFVFPDDLGTLNFVQLKGENFLIADVPVTQGIWGWIFDLLQKNWKDNINLVYGERKDFPIYGVTITQCLAFVKALNLMLEKGVVANELLSRIKKEGYTIRLALPTESQWKKAARGGWEHSTSVYSGGNNLNEVGWWHENSGDMVHEVRTKKPNSVGIYDMSGNVMEWCPKDENLNEFITCGGSCLNGEKECRIDYSENCHNPWITGFRLVLNLEPLHGE